MLTGPQRRRHGVMSWPSDQDAAASGVSSPASRRSSCCLAATRPADQRDQLAARDLEVDLSTATTAPKRFDSPSILTMGSLNVARSSAGLDRRPSRCARAPSPALPRDCVRAWPRSGRAIDQRILGDRLGHQPGSQRHCRCLARESLDAAATLGIEGIIDERIGGLGLVAPQARGNVDPSIAPGLGMAYAMSRFCRGLGGTITAPGKVSPDKPKVRQMIAARQRVDVLREWTCDLWPDRPLSRRGFLEISFFLESGSASGISAPLETSVGRSAPMTPHSRSATRSPDRRSGHRIPARLRMRF